MSSQAVNLINSVIHYNLSRLYNGRFIILEANGVQKKIKN